jgi:ribosome-associated heat shock protein Hsp15
MGTGLPFEHATTFSGATLSEDRQRIDKWLWHARVVRARSAAADLAASGHVRVNGRRIDAASRPVKAGDVVTVALDRTVRVMKVLAFAARRGSPVAARALYEDLEPFVRPAKVLEAASPEREPGSGRPTKRERRAIDDLRGRDD